MKQQCPWLKGKYHSDKMQTMCIMDKWMKTDFSALVSQSGEMQTKE